MTGPDPDRGGQNERTALAWLRTCLGFAGVVLLCTRLVGDLAVTLVVLLTGTAAGLGLLAGAGARYRRVHEALRTGGPIASPVQALAVSLATAGVGLVAVVLIVG